jgi:hypothetical protein
MLGAAMAKAGPPGQVVLPALLVALDICLTVVDHV